MGRRSVLYPDRSVVVFGNGFYEWGIPPSSALWISTNRGLARFLRLLPVLLAGLPFSLLAACSSAPLATYDLTGG